MPNQVTKTGSGEHSSLFSRDPFASFREEVNSLMNRAFGPGFGLFDAPSLGRFGNGYVTPSIDLHESETAYTLTAELPGLDEKDVELNVHDGVLTLKGEKRYEKESGEENARVVERHYGSFERSFTLPSSVDEAKIDAKFDKGVLKVTMPKIPNATPAGRRIAIGKS